MSDEIQKSAEESTTDSRSAVVTFDIAIKSEIESRELGDTSSYKRAVNALADEEILRRAGVIRKAKDAIEALRKDLNKIKPDVVSRSTDGSKNEAFSVKVFEERTKLQERINKLDDLFGKVISTPNKDTYQKLEQELDKK